MLEVIALTKDDVLAARDGGADRVELVGTMADDGLSASPQFIEEIRSETDFPLRVMLRTEAGFGTSNIDELIELADAYSDLHVDGVVLGYLKDGGVDLDVMGELLAHIRTEYTFHRAVDYARDYDLALDQILSLGGNLTSILTAGSPEGVGANLDRLASAADRFGHLMLIGGGLSQEHVAPLKEAGLSNFHVGSKVRPNGDFSQTIDPRLVEEWKNLTD